MNFYFNLFNRIVNGWKLDFKENFQREDQTTHPLSMKIKEIDCTNIIYFNIVFSYFVHGGRDLKEGALDNMWKLDLNEL